jgi:RNA polymerase sigma-70 factor (ECF subfamily)
VADTAEILGISPGTVKSRCARGRARLLPLLAHLRGSGVAAGEPAATGQATPGRNQPAVPRVSPAEGTGENQP